MKIIPNLFLLLLGISLIYSCNNAPEGEAAKTEEASETTATPSSDAKIYEVTSGKVNWTATKVGGVLHAGDFQVSKGKLAVENGMVTSGVFVMDINSVTETTLPENRRDRFLGHLKSDDFFSADQFPTGQFDIVSITPLSGNPEANYTAKGNLTLRGISKSISFPVMIETSENKVMVSSPKFTINRTEWDIKYDSAIIGTAADKIIHDDVSLSVQLEAAMR